MDPKAPRTATATLVLGLITWVMCVVSVVFKLGLSNGFGNEEIILLIIGGILFLISFLASREREEILMLQSLSVTEQFAAIESMPTKYNPASMNVDQFGFETQPQPTLGSQTIVASVLGQTEVATPVEMSTAIAALSSGDSGNFGAEAVRNNPAPHAHTEQFREVFKPSIATEDNIEKAKVENIPLPGKANTRTTPDLPWLAPTQEFQTSGVAQIPLPGGTQSLPETEPSQEKVVGIPELNDLFGEESQEKVVGIPELNDLFGKESQEKVVGIPELNDLFGEEPQEKVVETVEGRVLPTLPNLDDLF